MYTDVDNVDTTALSSVDFVNKRRKLFTKSFATAREMLGNTAERSKKRYDMRVKPTKYEVWDWVYYFCPRHYVGQSPKWQRFYSGPFLVIEMIGAVNLRIQKSALANAMVVHVDKVKHCTGDNPVSWLGNDNYNVLPPNLENDALPIMFGNVDRNASHSSHDELRRDAGVRPRRNAVIPARYLNRVNAVPITILTDEIVKTHVNPDCKPELLLCIDSVMTKNTQRMSRLLFKCQPCDEINGRDRTYTRSYDLIAHLVNTHDQYPISIKHNATYLPLKVDLRPATAEEISKYKDENKHGRKKAAETASTGEASASGTTLAPEGNAGKRKGCEPRRVKGESAPAADQGVKKERGQANKGRDKKRAGSRKDSSHDEA